MIKEFNNLNDLETALPTEDACINHFRDIRWPDGQIPCPHCGVIAAHYLLQNNTHKCKDCRRKFTVRNGSIFEDSKLPLRTWFKAIFLMTSHKKGISSTQLARDLGVSQKSAWFMLHRIRNAAMTTEFQQPLKGEVEIDEAYVGANAKWIHANKRKGLTGRAAANEKKIMFAMLQRDGDLRVAHLPNTRLATIKPTVLENVEPGSHIHTDESSSYYWMRSEYAHSIISHSLGQYVRDDCTTNRVENVFSHFKRSIYGVYHKASAKHLDRYLQMFAFRWNRRKMGEGERVNELLKGTQRRRITYRQLIGKV